MKHEDPIPIKALLHELMGTRGWKRRLDSARIVAHWESIVGPSVAKHCRPASLDDEGTLDVIADSAAWATQLSYLRGTLLDRLHQVCGPGLVASIQVRTDQRSSRRH